MSEITIKLNEKQIKMILQMLNMVQVKLAEAPDLLDLKMRLEAVEGTKP